MGESMYMYMYHIFYDIDMCMVHVRLNLLVSRSLSVCWQVL